MSEKRLDPEPDLVADLTSLGVRVGGTVLARAALRSMGSWPPNNAQALIAALLAAVGPDGTVVALTHSGVGRKDRNPPTFTPHSKAITGGFANALLEMPGAHRSSHPTNSIAAIGARAEELTARHDPDSACFGFVGDLIEQDAAMLLVGCSETGPGFSTVDYAQLQLGYSYQTRSGSMGAFYTDSNGQSRWFERTDDPSCSRGFGNLYREYLRAGVLRAGPVGDAYSLLGYSKALYAVDVDVLTRDPRASLCSDPLCAACRLRRGYNKRDIPGYAVRRSIDLASKLVARRGRTA